MANNSQWPQASRVAFLSSTFPFMPVNVIVWRPVMACTFHPSLCDDTGVTPQQTSFVTAGKPLKFDLWLNDVTRLLGLFKAPFYFEQNLRYFWRSCNSAGQSKRKPTKHNWQSWFLDSWGIVKRSAIYPTEKNEKLRDRTFQVSLY